MTSVRLIAGEAVAVEVSVDPEDLAALLQEIWERRATCTLVLHIGSGVANSWQLLEKPKPFTERRASDRRARPRQDGDRRRA